MKFFSIMPGNDLKLKSEGLSRKDAITRKSIISRLNTHQIYQLSPSTLEMLAFSQERFRLAEGTFVSGIYMLTNNYSLQEYLLKSFPNLCFKALAKEMRNTFCK